MIVTMMDVRFITVDENDLTNGGTYPFFLCIQLWHLAKKLIDETFVTLNEHRNWNNRHGWIHIQTHS